MSTKKKTVRAALSFLIIGILLVALFVAAVNIGSLKVSFPELLRGLFVEYNEDVATIYDLRFPRIVISILAGAAVAVSGDYWHLQRSQLCGGAGYSICPVALLFYAALCIWRRRIGIFLSVYAVVEGRLKPSSDHPCGCCGAGDVLGTLKRP